MFSSHHLLKNQAELDWLFAGATAQHRALICPARVLAEVVPIRPNDMEFRP